jgi:hypothetical protein
MPKSISSLRPDDFEPHTGETFDLTTSDGTLKLRLTEVQRLGAALREGGAFSLMFLTAAGPFLPQAIYPVEHPALGSADLFVVPLGPKDGGNSYQVIFT